MQSIENKVIGSNESGRFAIIYSTLFIYAKIQKVKVVLRLDIAAVTNVH